MSAGGNAWLFWTEALVPCPKRLLGPSHLNHLRRLHDAGVRLLNLCLSLVIFPWPLALHYVRNLSSAVKLTTNTGLKFSLSSRHHLWWTKLKLLVSGEPETWPTIFTSCFIQQVSEWKLKFMWHREQLYSTWTELTRVKCFIMKQINLIWRVILVKRTRADVHRCRAEVLQGGVYKPDPGKHISGACELKRLHTKAHSCWRPQQFLSFSIEGFEITGI